MTMFCPEETGLYVVTIDSWTHEIEAKNPTDARSQGVKVLREILANESGLNFHSATLFRLARARLKNSNYSQPPNRTILEFLPKHTQEWLTGFWEGDGSIGGKSSSLSISFSQKDPQILYYIASLLEGSQLYRSNLGMFLLQTNKKNLSFSLLNIISNNIVSQPRINQIEALIPKLSFKTSIPKIHKPTYPWIAGFWDAEGFMYLDKRVENLCISLTQKDQDVLARIREFTGLGRLSKYKSTGFTKDYQWYLDWQGKSAQTIVPQIIRYSKNQKKRTQLLEALDYLSKTKRIWKNYLQLISFPDTPPELEVV